MQYDFRCPSYGKKLFTYETTVRKYGCMVKKCKKCGSEYIDPRYHEIAAEGIPESEFRISHDIILAVIGVLIVWRGIYLFGMKALNVPDELQWAEPVLFLCLGAACIIGAVVDIILVRSGKKKEIFMRRYQESVWRLSNRDYADTLRKAGYNVPENFMGDDLKNEK